MQVQHLAALCHDIQNTGVIIMFKKLFTRKPKLADLERYVAMEYRPHDRQAALSDMKRKAGL